jgi:hypothetical protein
LSAARKRWTAEEEIIIAGHLATNGWDLPRADDPIIGQLARLLDAKPTSVHWKLVNMRSVRAGFPGAPTNASRTSRAVVELFELDQLSMQQAAHKLHALREGN